MAGLTGLFMRGSSYYIQVVLPVDHPLQNTAKNGKIVRSLGCMTHREALRLGTMKRAEILANVTSDTYTGPYPAVMPVNSGVYLSQVHQHWKESKTRSNDTVNACLRAVKLFEEFSGNPPIGRLIRGDGERFSQWLEHTDRKTTSKTARDRLIWVKSLLQFASQDLGLLPRNPWSGIEIDFQTTNRRRPWTDIELKLFFDQPLHQSYVLPKDRKGGADAAYWIPLLGLFTGARVGELAQLRVNDFRTDGDVPVIQITNEGEGQRVKTKAGIRTVPVHSELVRLGLLDYVEAMRKNGHSSLWPLLPLREGKPGGYFSHWFGEYRRSLGLGTVPDFHCYRHTVRTKMAEAGANEAIIDALIGHEGKGSVGAKVYTHRSSKTLSQAIEAIRYTIAPIRVVRTTNTP